jgi:hypothetical protein
MPPSEEDVSEAVSLVLRTAQVIAGDRAATPFRLRLWEAQFCPHGNSVERTAHAAAAGFPVDAHEHDLMVLALPVPQHMWDVYAGAGGEPLAVVTMIDTLRALLGAQEFASANKVQCAPACGGVPRPGAVAQSAHGSSYSRLFPGPTQHFLLVSAQRYAAVGGTVVKYTGPIGLDDELDLTPYCGGLREAGDRYFLSPLPRVGDRDACFHLRAFAVHRGRTVRHGHYYAWGWAPDSEQAFRMDGAAPPVALHRVQQKALLDKERLNWCFAVYVRDGSD